jgi:cytochrome P450
MRTKSARTKPPGPPAHWLSGNLREFARDRLGFLDDCTARYGDVVSVRLGWKPIVLVNHPDLVEEVLVTRNRHLHKHFALKLTRTTLGNGLLTSEDEFWRRQRKLVQPAFHRERIAAHAGVMVDLTERMLAGWADGQTRDVQADMTRLTLEIVAKTLFGAEIEGESAGASAAMDTALRCFTERVGRIFNAPEWVPTPVNLRLRRAVAHLDRIIFEMIAARRASGETRDDFLSMLLLARDEDDGRMTDRQLRDEAMTLFMAGHETTANTLAWVWYLLAQNPSVEARLHVELDRVLPDSPPTFEDLPRLPYTEHVVTEALRLFPTVWLLGREVVEPFQVGGYELRRGTTVYMSQWVIHRDSRFFEEPLTYRPERWENGLAKRLPHYAYFPFGGGPRICIGNAFAMMESVLLLATIARRYRLALSPDAEVTPLPTMTLRPAHGVKVVVSSRGVGLETSGQAAHSNR